MIFISQSSEILFNWGFSSLNRLVTSSRCPAKSAPPKLHKAAKTEVCKHDYFDTHSSISSSKKRVRNLLFLKAQTYKKIKHNYKRFPNHGSYKVVPTTSTVVHQGSKNSSRTHLQGGNESCLAPRIHRTYKIYNAAIKIEKQQQKKREVNK